MKGANKAVFLDRDGTLIVDKDYLCDPAQVEIYPEAAEGLRALREAGYLLFIVTNQSGVGRGYFGLEAVEAVHARLEKDLAAWDVHFERIYIAPEAPEAPSRGRKPSPQFLFEARDAFGVDLSRSFMVGDKMIDLQCGWNAGVKASILVRTGYGRQTEASSEFDASKLVPVFDSLAEAAKWIINQP